MALDTSSSGVRSSSPSLSGVQPSIEGSSIQPSVTESCFSYDSHLMTKGEGWNIDKPVNQEFTCELRSFFTKTRWSNALGNVQFSAFRKSLFYSLADFNLGRTIKFIHESHQTMFLHKCLFVIFLMQLHLQSLLLVCFVSPWVSIIIIFFPLSVCCGPHHKSQGWKKFSALDLR